MLTKVADKNFYSLVSNHLQTKIKLFLKQVTDGKRITAHKYNYPLDKNIC